MSREQVLTIDNAKEMIGIHFTTKHTGKMSGMQSLSTSCLCNKYCMERSKNKNTICSHCYAQRQMKMYKNLDLCLQKNTKILNEKVLEDNDIPLINAAYFRFESFGDLNSWIQAANYFKICYKNQDVNFALWTKNPWIIQEAIDHGYKKPKNLQIVLSSILINQVAESNFKFIDKYFTVYDKEYIKEHNVNINCGAKSCLDCHICYVNNDIKYIREKLK